MIDTHCHLSLINNANSILLECEEKKIITIAMTNLPSEFEKLYFSFRDKKYIRLALGFHPELIYENKNEFLLFEKLIDETSYIGEIGMDFANGGLNTKMEQMYYFEKILSLLRNKRKIISIHSRKAEKEILNALNNYNICNVIFHWYSGPLYLIKEIVNSGYYFSINPSMVISNNGCRIIKEIPLENILTETDAPFTKIKGISTKPADIIFVLRNLSKLFDIPVEIIECKIKTNFYNMLKFIK
jgi:TatD DNase family protein